MLVNPLQLCTLSFNIGQRVRVPWHQGNIEIAVISTVSHFHLRAVPRRIVAFSLQSTQCHLYCMQCVA
jgi:hypothetical protein